MNAIMSDTLTDADLQMLARIEWVFDWESGEDLCPECENSEYQAHKEGCALASFLERHRPPDWSPRKLYVPPSDRKSKESILDALQRHDWNGAAAARFLNIPLRTFRRYTKAFGIRKRFA